MVDVYTIHEVKKNWVFGWCIGVLTAILLFIAFFPSVLADDSNLTNQTANQTQNPYVQQPVYTTPTVTHAVRNTHIMPWSWFPNWLVFVLAIAIGVIIYNYLPEDLKNGVKRFIKDYWPYLLIFVFWLYFRTYWGYVYEYPNAFPGQLRVATFYALLFLLLVLTFTWLMYQQRYLSYAIVANNRSGSCAYYQNVGKWTLFKVGTSGRTDKKIVIPYPIPQELWVVPRCAWRLIGKQIIVESQIKHFDFLDMPESIANEIEGDYFANMAKDKIYFGLWSQKVRAEDPKFDEFESELTKAYARINELADMLKSKLKNVKGYISDTLAMTDKIRGKSWGAPTQSAQPQQQ